MDALYKTRPLFLSYFIFLRIVAPDTDPARSLRSNGIANIVILAIYSLLVWETNRSLLFANHTRSYIPFS